MSIFLVGEVVNHCDDTDGWVFNKKKPKKDKDKSPPAGAEAGK